MSYPPIGSVLADRYRIEAELGRGGFSVVYRATDVTLDSPVAVKLLVPPPAAEAVARERMRREAVAGRGLVHPNVVQLHDYLESDGHHFLVMQLVDGTDLARRVESNGPLEPADAVRVVRGVAAALEAAHGIGVLHRDVKPRNILLDADGNPRLADFGSARLLSLETLTRTGDLVGTLVHTAPEVVAGGRADARSDLYALGTTLYFALTGSLPEQTSRRRPPTPSHVGFRPRAKRPEVPPWLDEVTAKLTREDPGERYPTAGALLEALDATDAAVDIAVPDGDRTTCLLCGSPEPFGVGVCVWCLGPPGESRRPADDRLLFLERGEDRLHREQIADDVSSLVDEHRDAASIEAALRGELPLARVVARTADDVARRLRKRGLPVRIVHPARLGARLTPGLGLALGSALATGMAAGVFVAPSLLVITPVFAGTVVWAVVRRQSPALLTGRQQAVLPRQAERSARTALASLPPGAARRLLADFVRMARRLADAPTSDGEAETSERVGTLSELVNGAVRLTSALAELDDSLSILEDQTDPLAAGSDWIETHSRVSRTRDRIVQRLLDALATMARTGAAGFDTDGGTGGLPDLARELQWETEVDLEARREVEALLA